MTDPIFHRDPEILSGTVVFYGMRVPIKNLFDFLEGGETLDDFFEGFPSVRRDQVIALLKMAMTLLESVAPLTPDSS